MSEILTREQVEATGHHLGLLIEHGIGSEDGLAHMQEFTASHLAALDRIAAHQAEIERLREALEAIVNEYQDYCADKGMDTTESQYAMYDLALATLATPEQEASDVS